MYYAFYAKEWKGQVELRGLEDRNYSVLDYVDGTSLGTVSGPHPHLPVEFKNHLLLEVSPQ
jgi:alpha-galactosidase